MPWVVFQREQLGYANLDTIKKVFFSQECIIPRGIVPGYENTIGFYGSFTRGGKHNIILEYADENNLKDFFGKQYAPVNTKDIIQRSLWESFLILTDKLERMQKVGLFGSPGARMVQG